MSKELLKCMLSHEFYTQHGKHVLPEMFTRELQPILKTIQQAHATYECDLTIQEVRDVHISNSPTMSDSAKELLGDLLTSIDDSPAYNPMIAAEVIRTAYKSNTCRKIIDLTLQLEAGTSNDWNQLANLQQQAQSTAVIKDVVYDTVSLDNIADIVSETTMEGEYSFNIPELQKATTGLHKAGLYIIGARPEAGKTAFEISIICGPNGLIYQGANVHIWRNEERYQAMARRAMSCIMQVPYQDIESKLDDYRNNIKNTITGKLHILKDSDTHQKSITDVEEYIINNPDMDVLFIDQIDNLRIKGVSARNDVAALDEVYATIREYAIGYNKAIVVITQAGADADNKLYWDHTSLYGSKTSKAATGDVIICIGYQKPVAGGVDEGLRVLNYSKNKFGGPQPSTIIKLHHKTSTFTA